MSKLFVRFFLYGIFNKTPCYAGGFIKDALAYSKKPPVL